MTESLLGDSALNNSTKEKLITARKKKSKSLTSLGIWEGNVVMVQVEE